ncbi:MAG: hypothetical protein IT338_17495 [Thermomicrobiales bacterium]|nr:hypothetical protein [Thermomicrobiales bacterium]
MNETDQRHPVNSIVATDHEIHIRLGGLAVAIRLGADATDTAVINEDLYLPLYSVVSREIAKRIKLDGKWPQRFREFFEADPEFIRSFGGAIDASIATAAANAPATDDELAALLRGESLPRGRRVLVMQAALIRLEWRLGEQLPPQMREIGARLESLERNIQQLRSNVDANLTTRISKLESDITALKVQKGHQGDVNAEHKKAISELSVAVAGLDRAAPPELASLVELVTGQQDQIDKLQAMLEPRIPAGVVDGRPVAGPEIGIALDGEIARAIDRQDLATRTHVDEAVRRLAATIRQYVRDQVQQALRRRPSALRRVWDALADRGAPSAPAPAQEPAAVPPAIAELAEQALRRGR